MARVKQATLACTLRQAWLRQIRREYQAICYQYRLALPAPLLILSDSTTILGSWNSATRELCLSSRLIAGLDWPITVQILKHEMAHQICTDLFNDAAAGHGPQFRRAGGMLGLEERFCGARIDCSGLRELARQRPAENRDDKNSILARVDKLFALAGSDNEHEAALAMERAWQLLRRHNLEPGGGGRDDFCREIIVTGRKRMPAHLKQICVLLQDHFCVQVVVATTYLAETDREVRTVELFGRPANVDVAIHCYHFLLERVEHLWQANRDRFRPHARRARTSYLRGLIQGFAQRLDRAAGKRHRQANTTDLVPLCQRAETERALCAFVAHYHPRLVRRRGRRVALHDRAWREAVAEGRAIVLHRVVRTCGDGRRYLE